MTRPVHWSRAALDDLKEQVAFIAKDNRTAALRIADKIRGTATALGQRAIGRAGRVAGTYEKSVTGLPFIIAYALVERGGREGVVIVRVIHTARNWSPESWPE